MWDFSSGLQRASSLPNLPSTGDSPESSPFSEQVVGVSNALQQLQSLQPQIQSTTKVERLLANILMCTSRNLTDTVDRLIALRSQSIHALTDFTNEFNAVKNSVVLDEDLRNKQLLGLIDAIENLPVNQQYDAFCLFRYHRGCEFEIFIKLTQKLDKIKSGSEKCALYVMKEMHLAMNNGEDDSRIAQIFFSCLQHNKVKSES